MVAIRLAVDLGLFKTLADSHEPKSIQQLANATGADATLLGRILRCLASIDAIAEAGHEMYAATKISRAFTTPKGISGAGFLYVRSVESFPNPLLDATFCSIDLLVPSWANLPATLAKSHYQNPIDNLHTGLQAGLNIDYHGFEFLAKNPKIFNDFNIFMSAQREGRAYWLDFYPFEQKLPVEARDSDHNVLFVDVGGALGSEILELRKRFPALKGRMILQELPQTIEHVSPDPGMEATVHDFFTPQPVIGTQFPKSFFAFYSEHFSCSEHIPQILAIIYPSLPWPPKAAA